jgi:threonylcarbamoyladenosine tRNA methylthiotransferase MtaB
MKTFIINTFGCKVNQYESRQVREMLERLGLKHAAPHEKPDLAIINTCCITHNASAKSRKNIHKIQAIFPDTTIVVCGCLPVVQNDELTHPARNVYFIKDRSELVSFLKQTACTHHKEQNSPTCSDIFIKPENDSKIKHKKELPNDSALQSLTSFEGQTRAFLKIQDGCDARCTYCIVPKTRPIISSKPADEVIREAQNFIRAGHKEIVLTGIFIGAYDQESVKRRNWPNQRNDKFADLLKKIAEIPALERIRISSLEPADITDRLVDIFCTHRNIMPHLHLSLQSGSDNVLKKMCRQYRMKEVIEKIDLLKSRLDTPAITADIIVGFPGETDEDFEQTVSLAKYIGCAKMHVFRFSSRTGTAAAKMRDFVDDKIVKQRAEVLHNLDIELGMQFRRQFIGQAVNVLIESDRGQPAGRCERYFMVTIKSKGNKPTKNEIVPTKILDVTPTGVIGLINI